MAVVNHHVDLGAFGRRRQVIGSSWFGGRSSHANNLTAQIGLEPLRHEGHKERITDGLAPINNKKPLSRQDLSRQVGLSFFLSPFYFSLYFVSSRSKKPV
jgi:hypothetical protein